MGNRLAGTYGETVSAKSSLPVMDIPVQAAIDFGNMREVIRYERWSYSQDCFQSVHGVNEDIERIIGIAHSIAYYSLVVLARGRRIKNPKDGGSPITPPNYMALKLLCHLDIDDSGVWQDLISSVLVEIYEGYSKGAIRIGVGVKKKKIEDLEAKLRSDAISHGEFCRLYNESLSDVIVKADKASEREYNATMRCILNAVQHEFYNHTQRHSMHRHDVIYNKDGEEDDQLLFATAMLQYETYIDSLIDDSKEDILDRFNMALNERESIVLSLRLDDKQVVRTFKTNGDTDRRYEYRSLTMSDISSHTGLTVRQVSNIMKSIRRKAVGILSAHMHI